MDQAEGQDNWRWWRGGWSGRPQGKWPWSGLREWEAGKPGRQEQQGKDCVHFTQAPRDWGGASQGKGPKDREGTVGCFEDLSFLVLRTMRGSLSRHRE